MVNKDSIFIVMALALLASSILYSVIKVRMLKKSQRQEDRDRDKFIEIKKAGVRSAPKDFDPTDEDSGFTPLETTEEEFEQQLQSALDEYLDPDTPESRRSELAKQLQEAGYDIR